MAGMPELDELVLVTVKKIMPYGAFCTLDEYEGKEAFVHISEVAPRWIKNIHEFLHEGQKLVAKVYHIEPSKNQIDLSLKRVTEAERKAKMEGSRKERRAEKLFNVAVKLAKSTKVESLAAESALVKKYGSLVDAIEEIGERGEEALAGLKIEKGLAKALVEVAAKNIKKAKAEVKGVLSLTSLSPNGVEVVRELLLSVQPPEGAQLQIHYLGAPRYQLRVVAPDFKKAERAMEAVVSSLLASAKSRGALAEFSKAES
ncbi:MAG: translation initiation factor IF-2 subunit alpha [Candidatus Micrarchaeota archaeon]|nr:translation initiation factor IF-2 subunit alpha [Candidatus Micrarchaeota archaeon]